jgi:succinate dehydrogenase assembly factor 1
MSTRLSGMQKEVLALYRTVLREASRKDGPGGSSFLSLLVTEGTTTSYARHEFRKQAHEVKRTDFKTIEYKMRRGEKQVKILKMPGVKVVSASP